MIHPKKILLCADDFGLSEGISQGILKLVQLQRLSAVSCMVNAPYFGSQSRYLLGSHKQVKFGLHFNLTDGFLLSSPEQRCFGLHELLIKSHARVLNAKLIEKELNAQFEHYTSHMGRFPDFIDGHQHVHQFPIIRDILLRFYEDKLKGTGVFIRSTYPVVNKSLYPFKTKILAITGGRQLASTLKWIDAPHNSCFAGIYDFSEAVSYRSLFRQWLAQAPNNTLIMCHPGEDSSNPVDHVMARNTELAYFLSDDFVSDCAELKIQLTASPVS